MYSLYDTWGFPCVFPHSEISGSLAMCAYPKLIAAYHVLHRLLMPRHSPCALCSLTYLVKIFQSFAFNITKNISWLTSQYVLKLYYIIHMQFSKNKLVGLNGLEPSTSRLSGVRSNQLSYNPVCKIWQPPTFPYRLQHSIIGRLRLNHRVRDVYGCFP